MCYNKGISLKEKGSDIMTTTKLPRNVIVEVVNFCNNNIITDRDFDPSKEYHSEWFTRQFSFLNNTELALHLGEAFYQARFIYMIMNALNLPMGKNKGIAKFQIIQYASICEALINHIIEKYYKDEFIEKHDFVVFVPITQAVSKKTIITYENNPLILCKKQKNKASVTWARNTDKAEFACEKGIISDNIKEEYCNLYELRNNTHILKAVSTNYFPKLKDAQSAYELTWRLVEEIKVFCNARL
jgi:hypothetical protein